MRVPFGSWGLFSLAGLAAIQCQEPTQVELRVSTDLPCDQVHGTTVTVGQRGELEHAHPATSLDTCEPGANGTQHLGFVVFVPRGDDDKAFALKVVTAVSARSPDDCQPGDGQTRGYQGCIVARRELRYRPGHTLRLEVPMLRQCEGVECTVEGTCFDVRTCIPPGVTCSKEACEVEDHPDLRFPNPSGPRGEAGGAGAGSSAGASGAGGVEGEAGSNGSGSSGGSSDAGGTGGAAGSSMGGSKVLVSQVVTGEHHSCALIDGGQALCWGDNQAGQLGNGTTSYSPTPTPVSVLQSPGGPPLTGVRALALGYLHSCALVDEGKVLCWGLNDYGQLGDGTHLSRLSPVPVVMQSAGGPPLTGVQALAVGNNFNCALMGGGQALCWGVNVGGQLGDGTTTNRATPVSLLQSPGGPPLMGMLDLTLGAGHSCTRLSGGEVRCWGTNDAGQLGDGTTTKRLTPVPLLQSPGGPPLMGVQALALGWSHSCAVVDGGEVRCWGSSGHGRLGDGTNIPQPTPVPVVLQAAGGPPLTGVVALAVGERHSCARLSGGEVRCWGANDYGQLGDGTKHNQYTPVPVLQWFGGLPVTGALTLEASGVHNCAWFGGNDVRCWGGGGWGQLGNGMTANQLIPVPVHFP